MPIIEVNNLTKVYTNLISRKQKRAVDNISFSVEQGQIFGFLGP
ncbi:MAG: ABC transporter ATP-binding protein, partial [Candidatus Kapabacteria bacterium]|nr:ABC transporter ATP-binding protein [Candidatus Kapabacteria bacterium]